MTTAIVTLVLLAGVAIYLLRQSRANQGIRRKRISVSDIGEVYRQISAQGIETSFAVFVIEADEHSQHDTVEIQYSVENGKTGLDWILMSPANIEEKAKVMKYAESRGVQWQEKEMNDWVYLRIEEGDLVDLCTSLIGDLYGAGEVELKYGGFTYRA